MPLWFWQRDPILDQMKYMLGVLLSRQGVEMSAIEDLHTAVTDGTTVVGSAVTLLEGLAARLDAALASGDPAAIQAEVDAIRSNTQTLANAVMANTRP